MANGKLAVSSPTTDAFWALSATELARCVARGEASAAEITKAALDRITAVDPLLNCFTTVTADRALAAAASIDERRARGETLPPLAGVPFAAKNLFDLEGIVTVAGSRIHREHAPARRDATVVARLVAAGAIPLGALNMDEYAYGFTTENTHDGATRNPRDRSRIAGGSSGGSAAAVAAGLASLTLGTDTNGSIRVPSSMCGVFGLKPTFGRLSRAGSVPFVASIDHVGPFARSAADLALAYDAMQGGDARDPACAQRVPEPVAGCLASGTRGLRIGVLGGYFEHNAGPLARALVDQVAKALGADRRVELPSTDIARGAAFVITAAEGASQHIEDIRTRIDDFDPVLRERWLAGALIPAAWILRAHRIRRWYCEQVLAAFADVDVLIAPATPVGAWPIGTETMTLNGVEMPSRANLGLLTQPISFAGLPVAAVPVQGAGGDGMPLSVQLIARPWREDLCLRAAAALEHAGLAAAPAQPF
jgi:AtzE family amidohydrolase